jgi:hypothetical protein
LWVYAGLSAALARLEGPEPGRNRVVSRAGRTFRVNRRNGVAFP